MDYQDVFMGIVMFSMVTFVLSIAYVNTAKEYKMNVSGFSEPYDELSSVSSQVIGIKNMTLGGGQGGTSQDDSWTSLVRNVWTALASIPLVFSNASSLMTNVFKLFGVHPVIAYTFFVIMIAFVVFGIINAIIGISRR